ncbi:FAD binding domain-containing protein [Zalerion maritima]|uniref:FAD binding domain-containing protein n=1 Tax=Zalerion maritima TaxID=339359 RepID=A0AAD5RXS5_9PEZI|nr:FAD binding domain-containing protein [Zalerion maritima]
MNLTTMLLALMGALLPNLVFSAPQPKCRCHPSQNCWPSAKEWDTLASKLEGRLIPTVPLGTPCHDPTYNASACETLQKEWFSPETHLESSHSVMHPYWANNSCEAYTDRGKPCVVGTYVSYAVEVLSEKDIQTAVKFARDKNLRVVVRTTGHDYFGRSTGTGALAIWTRNLTSITVDHDYESPSYTGPAITLSAGVRGYQAIEAAGAANLAVLTGTCPTVGAAGGYIQGGGHSILSSVHGMAADQALSFRIVAADGSLATASPQENPDLFWALAGGSPGSFGVVASVAVRAHPDPAPISGARFGFLRGNATGSFVDAVDYFHDALPSLTSAGATVAYYADRDSFLISPLTLPGGSESDALELLRPLSDKVVRELGLGVSVGLEAVESGSLAAHVDEFLGPLPWGQFEVERRQLGSRLIPGAALGRGSARRERMYGALRQVAQGGASFAAVAANATGKWDGAEDAGAVGRAWREALVHVQLYRASGAGDWDTVLSNQDVITNDWIPVLDEVLGEIEGGPSAYVNEADHQEKDWKNVFYGENYEKLLEVKRKWDPEGFWYGYKSVGSEDWEVDREGFMCRTD